MANVDPFVVQWPQKWMTDPEIEPVITYLNQFLHDIFVRTGGGEDVVNDSLAVAEDSNNTVSMLLSKVAKLEQKLSAINEDFTPQQQKPEASEQVEQVIDLSSIIKRITDIEAQL